MLLRSHPAAAGFIAPCLPTSAHQPPSGDGWLHEIKHDGYRLMVRRDGAGLRLLTRNDFDWTERYTLIADAARAIRGTSFLIDGEAVLSDERGLAIFDLLRKRVFDRAAYLYAFDLLELNGADLRRVPIEDRQRKLARLIAPAANGILPVENIVGDGDLVYRHAWALGCEGIVSKRRGSPYRSGRSPDWIKLKNPAAPAVQREAEEEWGKSRRRP
jgi:bifunctional non-homologous end joining protein LigD